MSMMRKSFSLQQEFGHRPLNGQPDAFNRNLMGPVPAPTPATVASPAEPSQLPPGFNPTEPTEAPTTVTSSLNNSTQSQSIARLGGHRVLRTPELPTALKHDGIRAAEFAIKVPDQSQPLPLVTNEELMAAPDIITGDSRMMTVYTREPQEQLEWRNSVVRLIMTKMNRYHGARARTGDVIRLTSKIAEHYVSTRDPASDVIDEERIEQLVDAACKKVLLDNGGGTNLQYRDKDPALAPPGLLKLRGRNNMTNRLPLGTPGSGVEDFDDAFALQGDSDDEGALPPKGPMFGKPKVRQFVQAQFAEVVDTHRNQVIKILGRYDPGRLFEADHLLAEAADKGWYGAEEELIRSLEDEYGRVDEVDELGVKVKGGNAIGGTSHRTPTVVISEPKPRPEGGMTVYATLRGSPTMIPSWSLQLGNRWCNTPMSLDAFKQLDVVRTHVISSTDMSRGGNFNTLTLCLELLPGAVRRGVQYTVLLHTVDHGGIQGHDQRTFLVP